MNGTSCNENERGLLPYPVILAATKGDPEAMKIVVQHYQSYIVHLSMKKIRDENGNTYYGIDEDLRERLQAKHAYHSAVGKADPPKEKEAEPKKAKGKSKKKSTDLEL